MRCKYPVALELGKAFPCGQCLPCRINRRRVWCHRIMLEATQHAENSFITLTYSDENLPKDGSLQPRDLQLFLKKFRKALHPERVRYFAVGEYGDDTQRPHYHLALFGFGHCIYGVTRPDKISKSCCERCSTVRRAWGLGLVQVGTLEGSSASYVAGYTTKKMTSKSDARLDGRHPEFARMSLRPGIGGDAMHEVASVLMQYALDESESDVPISLRHGSKLLPLGRYLRRRLREMVGKEKNVPQNVLDALQAELRPMLDAAQELSVPYDVKKAFFAAKVAESYEGSTINAEARHRRFNRRRI